jgi:hypothetical protein
MFYPLNGDHRFDMSDPRSWDEPEMSPELMELVEREIRKEHEAYRSRIAVPAQP